MAGGCWAVFGASGFAHSSFIVCPRAVRVRFGFGSSGLRLAYQSSRFKGAFFCRHGVGQVSNDSLNENCIKCFEC